jgi:hypothetical protein
MPATTATANTTVQTADTSPLDTSPITGTLVKLGERFGVPVVLLLLVLWWARNDVVQPLLDAHFDFIETIVAGQKQHTVEIQGVTDRLDRLIELQERSP